MGIFNFLKTKYWQRKARKIVSEQTKLQSAKPVHIDINPPKPLPDQLTQRLNTAPLSFYIMLMKDNKETIEKWLDDSRKYIGIFLEKNANNLYINLSHSSMEQVDLENFAKLFYLQLFLLNDEQGMKIHQYIVSEVTHSFYTLSTDDIVVNWENVQDSLDKYKTAVKKQKTMAWFEDWLILIDEEIKEAQKENK